MGPFVFRATRGYPHIEAYSAVRLGGAREWYTLSQESAVEGSCQKQWQDAVRFNRLEEFVGAFKAVTDCSARQRDLQQALHTPLIRGVFLVELYKLAQEVEGLREQILCNIFFKSRFQEVSLITEEDPRCIERESNGFLYPCVQIAADPCRFQKEGVEVIEHLIHLCKEEDQIKKKEQVLALLTRLKQLDLVKELEGRWKVAASLDGERVVTILLERAKTVSPFFHSYLEKEPSLLDDGGLFACVVTGIVHVGRFTALKDPKYRLISVVEKLRSLLEA